MADILARRVGEAGIPDHGLRRIGAPDMVTFGGGLPDPALHPVAQLRRLFGEVLDGSELPVLGYGHDQGDAGLRALIAARSDAIGPEAVTVTTGSAEAIGLVARALIDPGDVVVAEAATYPGALKAFRLMGAEIVAAQVDDAGLAPDRLAEVIERLSRTGRRVKLLYTIATCHNPTATILSLERRLAVLDLARRHGFLVLDDNTYGDIRFGDVPPSFAALDPERTVHLGSFSKTIAPGLRAGWVSARPAIAGAIGKVRTDLGISPLIQRVVARFIESGELDRRLPRLAAHYRSKRDRMLAGLERHCAGLAEWNEPHGGFFVWLRLRHGDAQGALDAGERERVSFIPGGYFAAEPGTLGDRLRLSYGEVTGEQIDEGLARLGRALVALREAERA